MLLEVWKAVQLRLRAGRDFPIECITSPLLAELYASRYPWCSCGGWRCSRCGGPIERGKHITVHTCRKPNRPRWGKAVMQRDGMLDERSRCKLCVQPVGGAPHICSSPLACSFVADFSAIYEPWRGLGQEDSARVRRLQGQVVVVMPDQAHFQQPARALETGELMLFQGVIALSRVVAAGQQLGQDAANLLLAGGGGGEDDPGREPLQGCGLGLYSLLPLLPEQPLPADYQRRPGHPRVQQTWVCLYTGWLQHGINEGAEDLSTMQVCGWVWSCPKQAAVQPASEGGVAVLVNCAHGERANADTHPVWRRDLHYRIPYIRAVRTSPAGTEVLYDYRAVTFDVSEYNNLRLNPACGCGCGSRLLALANVAD